MNLDFGNINYLAVIVAVILNMVGGAAWYGILAKPWMAEVGLTREAIEANRPAMYRDYAIAILASIVIALTLATFVEVTGATGIEGLTLGLVAGIGFVATTLGSISAFEKRSLKLYLMNAGYPVLMIAIIGALLGYWQ
ncbi:MAG: DUF1761 domain-containing protein [Chloroflexi bacterium]|nr:DUF1761 domain-containing protein [Chloroflexota bacterium]MDA1228362.1 DUF1761 domain-containing protein [Chloroflexota bacterium]